MDFFLLPCWGETHMSSAPIAKDCLLIYCITKPTEKMCALNTNKWTNTLNLQNFI